MDLAPYRLFLCLALVGGCAAPVATRPPAGAAPAEIIVRYRAEVSAADRAALRERFSPAVTPGSLPDTEKWLLPPAPGGAAPDARSLAAAVAREPGIKYATPNFRRRVLGYAASELSTASTGQWGLAQIKAPASWDTYFSDEAPPGKGVTVAVLDSGVDVRHPDLAPNAARDASGREVFVDVLYDATRSNDVCRGLSYDWPTAYRDSGHPGPDGHGHGTHVAGIIAAAGNNSGSGGQNIVGVAPAATILPVKTMDCNGDGDDWNISYGIKAAADMGARIENLSIGGPEPSPILEDALAYAMGKGALIVVAAGNGQGAPVYYPAAYAGVIAVGSVDASDRYQSYSNVGPQLGLVAPGGTVAQSTEGILSTVPTYGSELSRSAHYSRVSGTSQAAPFVAGVAALIWSREPALSAEQVRNRLYASAHDLLPGGFDQQFGWGRVDALAALGLGDHRYARP